MEQFDIEGGIPLKGVVNVSGSKNSALPCLFASLLTDECVVLQHVPDLDDIQTAIQLLETLGKKVRFEKGSVFVSHGSDLTGIVPYDLVRRMRASVLVMGPLLARKRKAKVSFPGGCAIGSRPINYHVDGFRKMGVKVNIQGGYVHAVTPQLVGSVIELPFPSVGATENLIMGAVLAQGKTILRNAALEPEIGDLVSLLQKMGAKIEGKDTRQLEIEGVKTLSGAVHEVIPDRIEAGTYLVAAAITKGEVELKGANKNHMVAIIEALKKSGFSIQTTSGGLRGKWVRPLKPVNISTHVYPRFPTDMQAQWIALMSLTKGSSLVRENIFENRFLHVQELLRFGADIRLKGKVACVHGVPFLSGCTVMVSDLRAGAALVLAGLAARGKTSILRIYHLDRGYEKMEIKLRKLGARIKRSEKGNP